MKNVLLDWATDFSFRQKTASVEFSYSQISMSRSIKLPLHQNVWVTSGVGNFPSVCSSATSATLNDLNP